MAKEKSESELLFGEYYLVDEKKWLYKSIEDGGIYYREKGGKMFSRKNPRSADDNSGWAGPPIAFTR
jgi:hypothetical protein